MTRRHAAINALKTLAVVLAILTFLASIAPFTPAVLLALVNLPIAGVCLWAGAKYFALTLLYWSISAVLVSPMNGLFGFDSGYLVLPLLIGGVVTTPLFYVLSKRINRNA